MEHFKESRREQSRHPIHIIFAKENGKDKAHWYFLVSDDKVKFGNVYCY